MGTSTLIPDGVWSDPVVPQDVQTPTGPVVADAKYTDPAVLSIVVQDYQKASAWLTDRLWVLHWRESDTLYQSPRTQAQFEGSTVSRSNVSRFNVATQVNSLAPAITGAIFSDDIPFEIRPRPNVHQDSARAWKELVAILLELCDFKSELGYGIEGMCNQGTVIFKMGWEEYTELVTTYTRKASPQRLDMPLGGDPVMVFTKESDEFEPTTKEVVKKRPTFEKCELGTVYPNPKWNRPNQMWKCGWCVQEMYLNYKDLTKLRDNPDYDIPDDDTLRNIFLDGVEQTAGISQLTRVMSGTNAAIFHAAPPDQELSEDPLEQPMQILEWWSDNKVYVVLQQKVVIRNGTHKMGCVPYVSANFWNIENASWGMGCGRIAGSDQRIDQGITNAALDIIAYAVQPETIIARGANVPTQDQRRRLGGIRLVDGADATKAVMLVPQPQVPPDAWRALQQSQMTANNTTGADQAAVQGSLPQAGSSVGRSGTGAGMLQAAMQGRLQAPVERVIDGVFIPFLNFIWYNVKQRMTVAEIRALLANHLTQALMVDFFDFMNADLKFDTLAGTRLAARGRMAQALPFLLEVFGNQQLLSQLSQTGWKVNVLEITNMVMDVSGWKNRRDLVVAMTDQEKQTMMQQSQAAQQANSQQAQLAQKQQNAVQLEDLKIQGRIATNTVKAQAQHMIESPLDRATAFAERAADEHAEQASQFYGPTGSYGT
jgi:hypothetical protein